MTEHNVKHLDTDTYEVMVKSDEKDCQVIGMSLVQMVGTVPSTIVNKKDYVVMKVKTENSRGEIEQLIEELSK